MNDSIQDKNAEIATDSNFTKNKASLTIQGSQAEITYEDGTPVPADVISMDDNGNIRITGLTRTAKIKVPTVADTDLSDIASRYGVVYAHNTAEGNLSSSWQSKTATDKYTTNEYEMTKTGTIDENGVASWTVTLNPRKAILDPDHVPYFTDTLPSGMELDGKDVHTVEGLNPGEYTLKETAAPSGYKVAAPIAFTLEADGTVKVNGKAVEKITMIDEKVTTTTTRSGGPGSGSSKASKTKKSSAKTGDTNNVLPFAVMAAISAGAIAGVAVKKEKRR